ncbi:hypothetical protein JB92DRAFT_2830782 [Gautieria morchelliformis]|nr:hypothetical protein JB92DRAFT_2830782 [Gautieria morchelliformis]
MTLIWWIYPVGLVLLPLTRFSVFIGALPPYKFASVDATLRSSWHTEQGFRALDYTNSSLPYESTVERYTIFSGPDLNKIIHNMADCCDMWNTVPYGPRPDLGAYSVQWPFTPVYAGQVKLMAGRDGSCSQINLVLRKAESLRTYDTQWTVIEHHASCILTVACMEPSKYINIQASATSFTHFMEA